MTFVPANGEAEEICFLFEKNKDEDKDPPVYLTVESDDDTAGPSNVNGQNVSKILVAVKAESSDDSDNIEMFKEIYKSIEDEDSSNMEVDTFSEDEGKSDDEGQQVANKVVNSHELEQNNLTQEKLKSIINIIVENDSDPNEGLGYKYPFDYLRQFCTKCGKMTTRHKDLTKRRCPDCDTPLLFDCVICHRRYKSVSNIYSHLKTKYDCRDRPDLHCSMCDYTNLHKGFMKNHIEKRHGGGVEDLISCTKCGRHFKRAYNAEEHELSCGGAPYLECSYCDFKTTYRISLKVHRNNHILDPAKGAALVNEKFEEVIVDPLSESNAIWAPGTSEAERKKIIKQRNSKRKAISKPTIIDLHCRNIIKMYCYKCKETTIVRVKKDKQCQKCDTELLHECGLCSSKFNNYQNILRHMRARHLGDNVNSIYVCGICDRRYEGFKKLSRHETFCSRTLYCSLCPFTAKVPNVLKRHLQKWHFGPNKDSHHPCSRCGRQKRSYKGIENSDFCTNCA